MSEDYVAETSRIVAAGGYIEYGRVNGVSRLFPMTILLTLADRQPVTVACNWRLRVQEKLRAGS